MKKGFTLVELLAVIAILSILVIIAIPNVIDLYIKSKKEIFVTEVKNVYKKVEETYISSKLNNKPIYRINSEGPLILWSYSSIYCSNMLCNSKS